MKQHEIHNYWIRNAKVVGSTPIIGTILLILLSHQLNQTVTKNSHKSIFGVTPELLSTQVKALKLNILIAEIGHQNWHT